MAYANKGAASAMSRWCSHCRPITYSNNLFSALGVHHLLHFGGGIERSSQDLLDFARNQQGPPFFALHFLWCVLTMVIRVPYMTVLLLTLFVNEAWRVIEQAFCIFMYICSFGLFNFTRMNSFYATFMRFVESMFGKVWHDSEIRLVTSKRKCTLCKSAGCKPGSCYRFEEGWLLDQLHISCECFKRHVSNRMEISTEQDACRTCFEQADRVTEGKYLFRGSSLKKYAEDGCGVFNDRVIERYYDMERSMWVSVTLKTHYRSKFALPEIQFQRNDLDELLTVPISAPDRLFQMPELRYNFLKSRSRVEASEDIVYTPIVLLKRSLSLIVAVLAVRIASKTFREEQTLAIVTMVTLVVAYFINMLREKVTISELGGAQSRVSRMLAVDALSSASNLIRYNDEDASWSRHIGYGGTKVGKIDVLENILHNRAIVMGNKIVGLSREGISIYIADVVYCGSDGDDDASPNSTIMKAVKWRKGDQSEIIEATRHKLAPLSHLVA